MEHMTYLKVIVKKIRENIMPLFFQTQIKTQTVFNDLFNLHIGTGGRMEDWLHQILFLLPIPDHYQL